jgi:hypothetical protein
MVSSAGNQYPFLLSWEWVSIRPIRSRKDRRYFIDDGGIVSMVQIQVSNLMYSIIIPKGQRDKYMQKQE